MYRKKQIVKHSSTSTLNILNLSWSVILIAYPDKIICSKTRDEYYLKKLQERLANQSDNKKSIDQQFSKVIKNHKTKRTTKQKFTILLPNISNIVQNNWNILNISTTLTGLLQEEPNRAFKRNRSLKELIGSNCNKNGKVKGVKNTFAIGKCSPFLSKTGDLWWSQLTSGTTLISQQTKRKFKIYHKVNSKSEYVIYLIECILCNEQYLGRAETAFNISSNNHRNDIKDQT